MATETHEPQDGRPPLISTLPPDRAQIRLARRVMLVLVATLAVTVPFAHIPLTGTEPLVPAYAAAVLMNEGLTAALLFALSAIQNGRAVRVLAGGYLFAALLIIPWALTFPGVFAPDGLLGAGLQSTAGIAGTRRLALPLAMLAYALLKRGDERAPASRRPPPWAGAGVAAAGAALVAWVCIAREPWLPRLMDSRMGVAPLWPFVIYTAIAVSLAALALLWHRRRSVLDLWLMVALGAWLIETVLLGLLSSGRFSLGWWAGRGYGLASAGVVLLVLLMETATLYARLARSVAAERRVRGERLSGMDVLSAAIAHEVNQPLASMVASADAGLRWLSRPQPDLDEARAAFQRISDDGHRASRLIGCIRSMFRRDRRPPEPLDIAALIDGALRIAQSETRLDAVTVRTDIAAALPPVCGDPVQVQQVLVNLITNAVDAMAGVSGRARVLWLRAGSDDGGGGVTVTVEDTGHGLDPARRDRTFTPFFTTKAHGMGMGLLICRSIVEAHGGRLWLTGNPGPGATAGFTLPAARPEKTPPTPG